MVHGQVLGPLAPWPLAPGPGIVNCQAGNFCWHKKLCTGRVPGYPGYGVPGEFVLSPTSRPDSRVSRPSLEFLTYLIKSADH